MTSLENNRRPKFLKNPNQPFNERRIGQLSPNELDDLTHGTGNPAFDPIEAERRRHQAFLESAGANRPEQKEEKSRYSRKTKVIAGLSAVVAAATVSGVGGYFTLIKGAEAFGGAAGNKVAEDVLEDTGGSGVDIDGNTVTLPENLSRNEEVQYALDELEKIQDESIAALEAKGHDIDVGDGDENDTPKQIMDRYAVNSYSAWVIGKTDSEKAEKVIAGFIDPEIEQYDDTCEIATNGGDAINHVSYVFDASDVFKQTQFQNVPPNGYATRIITAQFDFDSKLNQAVFQQVAGTDPDERSWVLKKLVYANGNSNPDFVDDIQTETRNFN